MALGVHFGGITASSGKRAPRYVSTATQILSAAIGSAAPVNYNVSGTSPLCVSDGAGGRTCTIMLNATASASAQTVTVGAYKTAPSNPNETTEPNAPPAADLLSTGTTSVTVVAGAQNAVDVALAGVPAKITIAHVSSGLGLEAQPVAVTAYDASGAQIITSHDAKNHEIPYETPIAISVTESSPSHLTVDATTLNKPSDGLNALNGGIDPDGYHATITASAGNVSQSTAFTPFRLGTENQNVQLAPQAVPFNGLTTYAVFTLSASEYAASSPVDVDLTDCTGTNGKPRASIVGTTAFTAGVLSMPVYVTAAGSTACIITVTDADQTRRTFSLAATSPVTGPLTVTPSPVDISNDGTRGPAKVIAGITGGVPPYAIDSSSCAGVANVSLAVDKLTFTTDQFSDNCAVFVHDNGGNTIFAPVHARVYGVPLVVRPASISGWVNTFPAFTVTGGKPPYTLKMGLCFGLGIALSHSTQFGDGGPVDDFSGSLYLQNPGTCKMSVIDSLSVKVDVPVTVT